MRTSYRGRLHTAPNMGKDRGRRLAVLLRAAAIICAASLSLLATPALAHASTWGWTVFAGSGSSGVADGPALSATFSGPFDTAVAPDGSVYVADMYGSEVRKVSLVGGEWQVSTVATSGTGTGGLYYPEGLTVAADGTVYVACATEIMEITPGGDVEPFADEHAFNVCLSPDGTDLYATDGDQVLDYLVSDGDLVGTIGDGSAAERDGTPASAEFDDCRGLACDLAGNIYVTDYAGDTVRRIDATTHDVTTIAGAAETADDVDAVGTDARFSYPHDIAWQSSTGDLIVDDQDNGLIRRMHLTADGWAVSTIGSSDTFANPMGVSADPASGTVYVADANGYQVFAGAPLSDSTGPDVSTIGLWNDAYYLPSAVGTITAEDDDSGVASIHWWIDDDTGVTVEGDVATVTLPSESGNYILHWDARDNAGNPTTGQYTITILGAPTGLASPTHPDPDSYYSNATATLTWDRVPGAKGYSYEIDGNPTDDGLDTLADPVHIGFGSPTQLLPTTDRFGQLAVGDFNHDGIPDIAVTWPGYWYITVFYGNGAGGFDDGHVYTAQYDSSDNYTVGQMVVGDFNGDGWDDLAVVLHQQNRDVGLVAVMLNDGSGNLQYGQEHLTGGSDPEGLRVADVNGDGYPDLVVTNQGDSSVGVLLGNGDGSFQGVATYPTGASPHDLTVGDFNGDGSPDIATANEGGSVTLLLNNGDGTFPDPADSSDVNSFSTGSGTSPCAIASADFDGDGNLDVAVADAGTSGGVLLLNGDGSGDLGTPVRVATNVNADQLRAADVTGDGSPDIVAACSSGVALIGNDGTGSFPATVATSDITAFGDSTSVQLADFNADGVPDCVASGGTWGGAQVLLGAPVTATLNGLSDGTHYFHVRATGTDGFGGPIETRKVRVDTAGPSMQFSGIQNGAAYFSGDAPDSVISAVDPGMPDASGVATLAYYDSADDSYGETSSASVTLTAPTEPGTYFYEYIALDSAGNYPVDENGEFAVGETNFTIVGDMTGLTSPTHPDAGTWYGNDSPGFDWDVQDGVGYSYSIDQSQDGVPDTTTDTVSEDGTAATEGPLADGTWYFHVRPVAIGAGGGEQAGDTQTLRVNIDTTGPVCSIEGAPEEGGLYDGSSDVTLTATDPNWPASSGATGLEEALLVDGEQVRPWAASPAGDTEGGTFVVPIAGLPSVDGSHTYTIELRGTDAAGNVGSVYSLDYRVEHAAAAHDDTVTCYSRPAWVTPLSNDDDGVGDVATCTQPANGSVTQPSDAASNTLLYTPDASFLGTDTFTYTTTGGQSATVTVNVLPNVSAPQGVHASKLTTHSVQVGWSAPASFGSGFASYQASWRASGTVDWSPCAAVTDAGATTCTVDGLVADVTYQFRVTVTDTGEYSATSDPVDFLLTGPSVPVFPPVTTHGSTGTTLTLSGTSGEATVSIGDDASHTAGVGSVTVDGTSIHVTPTPTFSGVITLPVTVVSDGDTYTVDAVVTVEPADPYAATFGPLSAKTTRVQWAGSLAATGYRIYVGGRPVGTAKKNASSFTVNKLLGPNAGVAVQATGGSGTYSNVVRATYEPGAAVKIGTISFKGNSATLSASGKKMLRGLAALTAAQGFTSLQITGVSGTGGTFRSKSFRARLARARAAVVRSYLLACFKALHVKVKVTVLTRIGASISAKYRVAEVAVE